MTSEIGSSRLDVETIRQAAQGRWHGILANLSIHVPDNPMKHIPCPGCGGEDRFRFDNEDGRGTWYCNQCRPQAGDGFSLIENVRRCTFQEALRLVADQVGQHPAPVPKPAARGKSSSDHIKVWEGTTEDTGRILAYLHGRGLSGKVPSSLRLHPALPYWNGDNAASSTFPAMVAQVLNLTGEIIGVHRTYLAQDCHGKAAVNDAKKSLGALTGGAVRLSPFETGRPLILSEGIETGLACQEATGWPVWACVSRAGLESVQLPPEAKHMYIAVDLDRSGDGQKSAEALAQRLRAEGRTVYLVTPTGPIPEGSKGIDWLNVYVTDGAEKVHAAFTGAAQWRPADGWPTPPVMLGDLVDEMTALINSYISLPAPAVAALLSVWISMSYLFERFRYCGYLSLQSATPACGKSRLLSLIAACAKGHPQVTLIPTPAVLFRGTNPVLVMDEADKLRNGDKETMGLVMAVLNAGYERGAIVERVERGKEGFTVKSFPVYGPKVLAGLESLTDALADRCFMVRMQRTPARLPRLNLRKLEAQAQRIREGLAAWALTNGEAVEESYEGLPDELPDLTGFGDRFQDIAEPLITLASVADSERPNGPAVLPRLLDALQIAAGRREPSNREKELKAFLSLVRERLNGEEEVFLATADLLAAFPDVEGLERIETGKALAGFLKHFDLYRVSIGTSRGYRIRREWVEEWEGRYRA